MCIHPLFDFFMFCLELSDAHILVPIEKILSLKFLPNGLFSYTGISSKNHPQIFVHHKSYFFGELKPHAKFHNPTPLGTK